MTKENDKVTRCDGGNITVRCVAEWLASLPPEWQDCEFNTLFGGHPVTLKRIVALESKDKSVRVVAVNGMGSHLPFDDSYVWHHILH